MMYPKGFVKLSRILHKFNVSFEILNTRLPEHARETQQKLSFLLELRRMSTFAIGAIVNEGVSRMAEKHCFLNIGTWYGFSLFAGMSGNFQKFCVGVDNFSGFDGPKEAFLKQFHQLKSPDHSFYEMDYQAYFAEVHKRPIGCYLYDGDHSYENQLQGLRIAEPFFSEVCIIVIDDTNRTAPRQATLDFVNNSSLSYQILLDQQTCVPDHPTFWNGLMVLQRVN
jgi:hypothetical protein